MKRLIACVILAAFFLNTAAVSAEESVTVSSEEESVTVSSEEESGEMTDESAAEPELPDGISINDTELETTPDSEMIESDPETYPAEEGFEDKDTDTEALSDTEDEIEEVAEAEPEEELEQAAAATVSYRTHVQSVGWQGWKKNGTMSGTSGQAKRLEAIQIKVSGVKNLGIRYKTHIQSIGCDSC